MSTPIALSFCEPVTAGPLAPWHIRTRPDGEPLKPGGGILGTALCQRDLRHGWDIPGVPVDADTLAHMATRDDRGRPGACPACSAEAARLLGA